MTVPKQQPALKQAKRPTATAPASGTAKPSHILARMPKAHSANCTPR